MNVGCHLIWFGLTLIACLCCSQNSLLKDPLGNSLWMVRVWPSTIFDKPFLLLVMRIIMVASSLVVHTYYSMTSVVADRWLLAPDVNLNQLPFL